MKIADIDDRPLVSVKATDPAPDVVQAFEQYDRAALPVVDADGHMLGIITHDDVLEFAERRATEDMQRMGGSEALDKPYFDVGFWEMVKKRGGWLAALFLGEMLTATAMGYFEGEIEKAAVVALFVPLIISSGGNSGSQGTSLIIRSLALREIQLKDWCASSVGSCARGWRWASSSASSDFVEFRSGKGCRTCRTSGNSSRHSPAICPKGRSKVRPCFERR